MANTDPQQTLMVDSNIALSEPMSEVTDVSDCLQDDDPKGVIAADILQQAFKEAEELSHTGISYPTEGNAVTVSEDRIQFPSDHSYITSVSCASFPEPHTISNNYGTVDTSVNIVDTSSAVSCSDFQGLSVNAASMESNENANSVVEELAVLPESGETELSLSSSLLPEEPVGNRSPSLASENVYVQATSKENNATSLQEQFSEKSVMSTQSTTAQITNSTPTSSSLNPGVTRVSLPSKTTSAPLGSSENPIQIIQQGNTYHSTQVLTKQQLQQIAHVLQQQQVNKVMQNGGKAVLYDEATNTRIIYRVIYPSELQEKNASDSTGVRKGMGRGRNRSRRGWCKRPADDLNRGEVTLSKQEKEEKKKHRPRTRSGRISKPPSYMVKDYKRLHHLDFYEEPHDDSDGGYSDYQISDEERGQDGNASTLPPGVSTTKQRNFTCETCDKAYIGRGGLARHYRLNPTHGNLPEGEGVSTQDENSNSSLASSVLSNSGYPSQTTNANVSFSRIGKVEPETSSSPTTASAKKKAQLKELLSVYHDDELIEMVMPRLVKALTLWKFLLLKHETEEQHNIPDMFKDFEVLLNRMKKVAQNCFSPTSSLETSHKEIIEIKNDELAKIFSLSVGSYKVENSEYLSSFEELNRIQDSSFEDGMSELLTSPPLKRKRINSSETSAIQEALSAASLPDQLLSDVVPEVSGIELAVMHPENLESEIHHPDNSHLLNATLSSTDFHNALNSRVLFDLAGSTVAPTHLQTAIGSLTTVTSTSLSSGSLSTVVTPESLKTHSLISLRKSQQFDSASHTDVQNIHLALHNSASNSASVDISTNPSNLESDQGNEQEHTVFCSTDHSLTGGINSAINNTIHLFETGSTLESGTVILGLKQLPSVPNISVPNTGISLLKSNLNFNKPLDGTSSSTDVHTEFSMAQNVTNCLNLDHPAQNEIHNQSAVSECSENICTNVAVDSGVEHSENNEHFSDLPEVSPVDEPSEALQAGIGSPSIIRQLMLSDGQVIGIWSAGGDHEDKDMNDQLVQGFLPGNLIIVQNSDGSLQLPNDQDISSENLQALLMNQEESRKDSS